MFSSINVALRATQHHAPRPASLPDIPVRLELNLPDAKIAVNDHGGIVFRCDSKLAAEALAWAEPEIVTLDLAALHDPEHLSIWFLMVKQATEPERHDELRRAFIVLMERRGDPLPPWFVASERVWRSLAPDTPAALVPHADQFAGVG